MITVKIPAGPKEVGIIREIDLGKVESIKAIALVQTRHLQECNDKYNCPVCRVISSRAFEIAHSKSRFKMVE